jgi:LysM repeat protein
MRKWVFALLTLMLVSACTLSLKPSSSEIAQMQATTLLLTNATLPADIIPPSTPLPSLTPTRTLLPPPTFEPPTLTPFPTNTLLPTAVPTQNQSSVLEGVHGLETPSPSPTIACRRRDDWGGRYTVQPGDILFNLAHRFNTTVQEIAEANCLRNITIISVGLELVVPGSVGGSGIECVAWEVLTPMNATLSVAGSGTITFNWRGPRSPRNLIRIHKPDGGVYERVIELRQNETIDLADLPLGGTYTWYVYPLDSNFRQIECLEGGPWTFTKAAQPRTPTPGILPGA